MPKPKHKKRKFIDPKRERTATFKLIHRGQRDPLAADESAPQRLLQPIIPSSKRHDKETERKYGIFYDDDYNYLQHLKDRKDHSHDFSEMDAFLVKLPPETVVIQAKEMEKKEEKVGLLNKAAPHSGPRLDWDPDIVAAMDDDFDFDNPDNELDDDFVIQANEGNDDEDEDEEDTEYDSEECDEVASLDGRFSFSEEETATRFTSYSMSSSVMRRNEGLTMLDDRFENFYQEYDDIHVGALDCDEIEGNKKEDSDVMNQIVNEFEHHKKSERTTDPQFEKTLLLTQEQEEEGGDVDKELAVQFEKIKVEVEDKWDCESILSTYSNIYNHPKLISERKIEPIKISSKTGIPKDVLGKGLTAGALKRLDMETGVEPTRSRNIETATHASRVSQLSFRNKYETKEEKHARKEGMKEYKRERRVERKANRDAFREEKTRQEKIVMNNKRNLQGIKLL